VYLDGDLLVELVAFIGPNSFIQLGSSIWRRPQQMAKNPLARAACRKREAITNPEAVVIQNRRLGDL
jgi:hypothetical protein